MKIELKLVVMVLLIILLVILLAVIEKQESAIERQESESAAIEKSESESESKENIIEKLSYNKDRKIVRTQIINGIITIKLSQLEDIGINDLNSSYSYHPKGNFWIKYNNRESTTKIIQGKINLSKLIQDLQIKDIY